MVINGTTTYLSLSDVPANTAISNTNYWTTLDGEVSEEIPLGLDNLSTPDNHIVELNSSTTLEMLWVKPGTFTRGDMSGRGSKDEKPPHEVIITEGYYLGKFEVTQSQYEAVMTGNEEGLPPLTSGGVTGPNNPVNHLSYQDVQVFLKRLNQQQIVNIPEGWEYALPTEAEWEYACRAGSTSIWSPSDLSHENYDITIGDDFADPNSDSPIVNSILEFNGSLANYTYKQDMPQRNKEVGLYPPNLWGFHDMHGNIAEWVHDWYGPYDEATLIDPKGPKFGTERVIRGGSFENKRIHQTSANRGGKYPEWYRYSVGFRVALKKVNTLPTPPTDAPGQPPADDYQETIAGFEEQIEQLMADLNAANEEISQKDETIAELQSTNQELADENEDLRGELVEEVEKNDVLTVQVANLTHDNNNLKYDLEIKTEQLEQAVEMAQVPFINGWVYDNDRGWIFTDAEHYPMVYTHKDDTWHYFELGSNPRYFFNFTSQQWEAWDALPEENDSNLVDSNNL